MELFKETKKEELEREIKKLFPLEDFTIGELIFGGTIPIVLVRFKDIATLTSNWKDFNSYLAAEFMTSIIDEYSKWNFYIFYLSKDLVEKALKYEIENNKFSSRKIVIENFTSISEEEISKIISEHITNDNIQINVEEEKITKFPKDVTLSKIIDKISTAKKNNDEEMQKTLDLIEKTYKNEI